MAENSRSIEVRAEGSNLRELELDAIHKARKFFGESFNLTVSETYIVHENVNISGNYWANVSVHGEAVIRFNSQSDNEVTTSQK